MAVALVEHQAGRSNETGHPFCAAGAGIALQARLEVMIENLYSTVSTICRKIFYRRLGIREK